MLRPSNGGGGSWERWALGILFTLQLTTLTLLITHMTTVNANIQEVREDLARIIQKIGPVNR